MDAEEDWRQLEVDEEDDDAEVDECVRSRNEIGLLVQYENDWGYKAWLGIAEKQKMQSSDLVWSIYKTPSYFMRACLFSSTSL